MPPEIKIETPANSMPEQVTKVLEELKAKLDNPPEVKAAPSSQPSQPSWTEMREEMKKKMGFNDEQMDAHEQSILSKQAPVVEELGWMKLKERKEFTKFEKEIREELAMYPPQNRTPVVMEKIYLMVRGKHADDVPANPGSPKPAGGVSGREVVRTRVAPAYSGTETGIAGGSSEGTPEEELTEQEQFVASKLGVDTKEYAKARESGKSIRTLEVPIDWRNANNSADLELRRLKGRR